MPPSAAEFYIEAVLDSLILLRKINESSTASNNYLAQSAKKKTFDTTPNNAESCQKYFAACGGRIFFSETRHFHGFASRNRENDVSLKILFGAKRRKKDF
ncbi:MAG: hypothetical protein ACOYOO_13180 [Saprospiraceae bacterium]